MIFNFQRELIKAQQQIKNKDIEIVKMCLTKIKNYINKLGLTGLEAKHIIEKQLNDDLLENLNIGGTNLIQKQVHALQFLKYNPKIAEGLYKKYEHEASTFDVEKNKELLQGSEEDCIEFEIKLIVNQIQEEIKEIQTDKIKTSIKQIRDCKDPKQKAYYDNMLKTDKQFKQMFDWAVVLLYGNDLDKINYNLNVREIEVSKILFELQKRKLIEVGKFLKKYDFLRENLEKQNKDYQELSMSDMKYNMKSQSNDDIGLEDIFTEEYIDSIDIEKLAILNAFWQNRTAKNVIGLQQALFVFDNLDLWEDPEKDISDQDILNIMYKNKICDSIAEIMKKTAKKTESKDNINRIVIHLKDINEDFKIDYEKYFDGKLPKCSNDFNVDITIGNIQRNMKDTFYTAKIDTLKEILLNIHTNHNITNWGYIPEKVENQNTLKRKEKYILIGIDYPGFNMPLKVHLKREDFTQYFRNTKNINIIPIYQGAEDMKYRGKRLSTKILMPLTPNREGVIIEKNKKVNPVDVKYAYIKHMGNLLTKKSKKIQKIYPTRYVDLDSGKEGIMVNRMFVPDINQTYSNDEKENCSI